LTTAIVVLLGGAVMLGVLEWNRAIRDQLEIALSAPGAVHLFGAVCAGFVALIGWSIFRPAPAAVVLPWSSTAMAACGLLLAVLWRGPIPDGGTLGGLVSAHEARAGMSSTIASLTLGVSSALAGAAAVAFARRARRRSTSSRTTGRTIAIAVIGAVLAIGFVYFAELDRWREIAFLVIPVGATIIALSASSTLIVGGSDAFEDAARATVFALGATLLGIASAGLAQTSMTTEPLTRDVFVLLDGEVRQAVKHVAFFGVVPIVLALVALRRDAQVWRAASRSAVPMLAISLGAALACAMLVRSSLAHARDADAAWPWPPMAEAIADDEKCFEVVPSRVVRVTQAGVRMADGDVLAANGTPDFDAIAARFEVTDPQDDMWLAVDEGAPFGSLGGVLEALGRARALRATGLAEGQPEPLEGCAMRLVGRGPGGNLLCTEATPLLGACFPTENDQRTWWVTMRDAATAEVGWRVNGQARAAPVVVRTSKLDAATADAWNNWGTHRDAYDKRVDRAVIAAPPTLPVRDVMQAVEAVRSIRRQWGTGGMGRFWRDEGDYGTRKRAVFTVSLALAAP
jgi:hypothetical protein